MQVGNNYIVEQTVHPFTSEVRRFNQKEANSSGGCFGSCGMGSKALTDKYTIEHAAKFNELQRQMDMFPKNETRAGMINPVIRTERSEPHIDLNVFDLKREDFGDVSTDLATDPIPSSVATTTMTSVETGPLLPPAAGTVVIPPGMDANWYTYNSYADNRAPLYNQWTRNHEDNCEEENQLRISSKPMKYYTNQYNTPQVQPFMDFTLIGNQKQYDVRNQYERAIPTRLNPIYPVTVEPYLTTPFLGATNPDRAFADTSDALRFGTDFREKKSTKANAAIDWNRFDPGVNAAVVMNAGQFNDTPTEMIDANGYVSWRHQNNVMFLNGAFSDARFGVSTRDLLRNINEIGCSSR